MAAVFTWTSCVDTDLAFSEFFDSNHTLTLRYLTPCSKGYEGPCIAENGQGSFALGQGPYFIPPDGSDEPGSPRLYIAVGTQMTAIKIAIDPLKWYHLALVFQIVADGRLFTLYRDGKVVDVLGVANGAWRGWLRVKDLVASRRPRSRPWHAIPTSWTSLRSAMMVRCPPRPGINTSPTAHGRDGGASEDEREDLSWQQGHQSARH